MFEYISMIQTIELSHSVFRAKMIDLIMEWNKCDKHSTILTWDAR